MFCRSLALMVLMCGALPAMAAELLVSDRVDNRILRYDSITGQFLSELVGPGNAASAGDLDDPASMALSDDGTLFVASRANGKVLQYDVNTGEFLGEFATGIYGPSGLLVDGDRNQLLVSEFGNFDGELIKRFDLSTGEALDAWGAGTGAMGRSDLAFGPDGMLYAGSFFDGRVLRFDSETGAPQPSVSGDVTATFAGPVEEFLGTNGLAFYEDRLLTVGLFSSNVFQFQQTDGSPVGELIGALDGGLFFPADLLIDQDGNLLVSSLGNDDASNGLPLGPGYIGKYAAQTGEMMDPFFIAGAGQLAQPTSMLLLPDSTMPGLMPGDADQDLDFDQFDLINVQVAAKYLTSEPATWGDGDWNGGPGGNPGDPPLGDGRFDNHDIIAALTGGVYAMGPYAATTPLDPQSNVSQTSLGRSVGAVAIGSDSESNLADQILRPDSLLSGPFSAISDMQGGSAETVPVPEPATCLLLLVGLPLVVLTGRRRLAGAAGQRRRIIPVRRGASRH